VSPSVRSLGSGSGRRLGAGLVVVLAVAAVVVIVLSAGSTTPGSAAGRSANGSGSGSAVIERQNLTETDTESGTLSYNDPHTVYNALGGTVTWLPAVGQVIKPGQALYRVNNEPVILMNGSLPAYRDLDSSDSAGPDITELNRNLVALGFNADGITVDDTWQSGTTLGIDQFQESLGEKETGKLPYGQVVFLPGNQLIGTVDGTVGSIGAGTGSPAEPASLVGVESHSEFVDLETTTTAYTGIGTGTTTTPTTSTTSTTPTTTTSTTGTTTTPATSGTGKGTTEISEQTLAALIALLKAETAALKHEGGSSPSSGSQSPSTGGANEPSSSKSPSSAKSPSDAGSAGAGSTGAGHSATAILETTSTQLVVTVDLDATLQNEATVGEPVTVEMPAGNRVNGRITAVSPVAQSSDSGDGSGAGGSGGGSGGGGSGNGSGSTATIPVTIVLSGHIHGAGLDQAAVSVNFAKEEAKNVLSVPVTALVAVAGGTYDVQEAAAPHKLIPVTTGVFAAGDVQISGPGIHPGLQVTDSQG
jgi:hypothetical protein